MKNNFHFFKTTMPESRKADFYLGCFGGSVFLDFNYTGETLIYLCRISFDGYGCCQVDNGANCLDYKLSSDFVEEFRKSDLNQEKMTEIVLELIRLNKENIWADALEEYFLDKNV